MPDLPKTSDANDESATGQTTRFGARSFLYGFALALVAVPGALTLMLVQQQWEPLVRADEWARDSLHAYALTRPWFVTVMQLISDSGSGVAWQVVLTVVVGWLLWRRLPRLALFVAITAIASSVLNAAVKASVDRLRPVLPDPVAIAPGPSFPSGHAQAAIVGYAILLLVFLPVLHGVWRRAATTLAIVMVLAIGFSRIALGVHYLSDVLGGFILGAAWVAAMSAAFNAMQVDRGRRPVDVRQGLSPEEAPRLGDRTEDKKGDLRSSPPPGSSG